jgi:hypothetical protein
MGWGATIEGGDPVQSYLGAGVFPCVFAAQGSVDGDVVKLKATQIFTGSRHDQGTPWLVEANLTTGFVHGVEVNAGMGRPWHVPDSMHGRRLGLLVARRARARGNPFTEWHSAAP